jgi:CubicO group peptidase (beta-lactamase class C family)
MPRPASPVPPTLRRRAPALLRAAALSSVTLAWWASLLSAQTIRYPAPPAYAPNPAVDGIFAQWDKPGSPGCALGVMRDGRFIYERGYGMANLDYDVPNTTRMVYYIGSDSKQFTAASIALLSLQGRISLSDDIRKYVPEMPDYGTPVTIADLVHHTSGVRDIYTLMSLAGLRLEDVFPDSEALALIARQKELNFKPGTDYLYSNSGYWLLAEIVKRVTGESLRVFADSAIFQPLGMTHTHFHDMPGHIMPWRAMSYERNDQGGFRISYLQNFDKIGAGGLYSTVEDLQKWDENYYTHRVGGDALQKVIHQRGVLADGDTLTYAFGNEISTYRGLPIEEHGGAMMGYKAHILRFPEQHFSVIETCNLGDINPGPLAHQVADVYLADVLGPEPPARQRPARPAADSATWAPTEAQLTAFAGDYYSDELDVTYHLAVKGGHLTVSFRATPEQTLRPQTTDVFRAGPLVMTFQRDASGRPSGFEIEAGRVQHMRFARR